MTLPAGTDVTARDKLLVGSRTFDVLHVPTDRSWEISLRVLCNEIL